MSVEECKFNPILSGTDPNQRLEDARLQLLQAEDIKTRDDQEKKFTKDISEGNVSPIAVCIIPEGCVVQRDESMDFLKKQFPEIHEKNKGGLWIIRFLYKIRIIVYFNLPLNDSKK